MKPSTMLLLIAGAVIVAVVVAKFAVPAQPSPIGASLTIQPTIQQLQPRVYAPLYSSGGDAGVQAALQNLKCAPGEIPFVGQVAAGPICAQPGVAYAL